MSLSTVIVVLVFLLMASAFFSASETALFSLTKTKVEMLGRTKGARGRSIANLLSKPSNLLITILIGNNAVNILSSAVSAHFITNNFKESPQALPISIFTIWLAILVFGEVTPKIIAIRRNESLALVISPILSLFSKVCFPLRITFKFIADFILNLIRQSDEPSEEMLSEKELKTAFRVGHREGELDEVEERILRRIMEFSTKSVTAAMTPSNDLVCSDIADGLDGIIRIVKEHPYSRIPVYEESLKNIVGIAYVKDLVTNLKQAREHFWSLLRPPLFIPEQQKIGRLFLQLQRQKMSMAVVVDEYGTLQGLVTLQDLLDQIVGGVTEPTNDSDFRQIGPQAWMVRASMGFAQFQDALRIDLPEGDYDTIGGYVISLRGEIPRVGQRVRVDGLEITISEREQSRLLWLRVERKEEKTS